MRLRLQIARLVAAGCLACVAAPAWGLQDDDGEQATAKTLPGVALAEVVATTTGIAISPLLGVSAVGAWHYYRTEEALRAGLPWYASPWFWIPGFLVTLLLVAKDPVLGLVPLLKKPLDAVDVLENKISAVLATPAVISMFLSVFAVVEVGRSAAQQGSLALSHAGVALPSFLSELPDAFGAALGAALLTAAFFCVWLASHAINVLILLSPFGPLDLLLRSLKLVVLVVLVGSSMIHPYLGLAVALLILVASLPIAAWSFRLMVFGGVLATDLVTRRHRGFRPSATNLTAFSTRRLGTARARTYGRVVADADGLIFSYRPWLLLPPRTVRLAGASFDLGRGLLSPILRRRSELSRKASLLRFPPRYSGHEEQLVGLLGLEGVEDLASRRGIRACFGWLRETVGSEPPSLLRRPDGSPPAV